MASIKEVQAEFGDYRASWHDLRPFLVQYLPHDTVRLNKADRLFATAGRYLEGATRAEEECQKLRAWWWYVLALVAVRDHSKLMDELGKRGLRAQEEGNRLNKTSA